MGKCVDKGYIPYAEINICDGCIHKDVCGDKDYLTENVCSEKLQGDIEHIAELINAEEQGRLIMSPCKVGDAITATVLRPYNGHSAKIQGEVSDVQIVVRVVYDGGRHIDFLSDDFGKTLFLAHKEAKKALEEANRNG